MIAARRDARSAGSASLETLTIPITFTSRTWCHSSSSFSSIVPCAPTPALLISTSKPPNRFTHAVTARLTARRSVTSPTSWTKRALSLGAASTTATAAPCSCINSATASPMPEAPPVTRTRIPRKSLTGAPDRVGPWCGRGLKMVKVRNGTFAESHMTYYDPIAACSRSVRVIRPGRRALNMREWESRICRWSEVLSGSVGFGRVANTDMARRPSERWGYSRGRPLTC